MLPDIVVLPQNFAPIYSRYILASACGSGEFRDIHRHIICFTAPVFTFGIDAGCLISQASVSAHQINRRFRLPGFIQSHRHFHICCFLLRPTRNAQLVMFFHHHSNIRVRSSTSLFVLMIHAHSNVSY